MDFSNGLFFSVGISWLLDVLGVIASQVRLFNVLGLFPAILDLSENLLQIFLVANHPQQSPLLASLSSLITLLKWLSLNACLLMILIGIVVLVLKKSFKFILPR